MPSDDDPWIVDGLARLAEHVDDTDEPAGEQPSIAPAVPPRRSPRRTRWTFAVAAAAAMVVGSLVIWRVASRPTDPDVRVEPPARSTTVTSAPTTTAPVAAPRWSSTVCRGERKPIGQATPYFPDVAIPDGMALFESEMTCLPTDEAMISDEWRGPSGPGAAPGPARRLRFNRIELRNLAPTASGGSGEQGPATVDVNGKPASFVVTPGLPGGVVELTWEMDANGSGDVVAQGFSQDDVAELARSFDAVVAANGPRRAPGPLTRDDALTKATRITSSIPNVHIDRFEAKRTTWATLAAGIALSTDRAGGVDPSAAVWALSLIHI